MSRSRQTLPSDELTVYATDSYTGDVTASPVFRYGRWWDRFMFAHHRRDLQRDQAKLQRNRDIRAFMNGQSASAGV